MVIQFEFFFNDFFFINFFLMNILESTTIVVKNGNYRVPVPLPNEGTHIITLSADRAGLKAPLISNGFVIWEVLICSWAACC